MKWIKRGRQFGQAVKNVQRLRQIISVFARHGFGDVIQRLDLGRYLPGKFVNYTQGDEKKAVAERLRMAFEDLGPTFVKLGQVLATRSDILPESYIEEFLKLQDKVQPISTSIVREIIERELGKSISLAYASFGDKPLASASIAQVHTAVLKTGEKVVIKVQRPGIAEVIDSDISILDFIARLLEKYIPETRLMSPTTVVQEFFRTLSFELDFLVEANNIERISKNLSEIPGVIIPKIYKTLSTTKILTLEQLEGIPVSNTKALDEAGIDKKHIVRLGTRVFFKAVMIDGFFHADLHGGNLFVLPGNKLGVIDFGIVGRLSEKSRGQLANMVMALITEDFQKLCYYYAELGASGPGIDLEAFEREVQTTIAPYMGLSLKEVNAGKVLIEATKIATKYNIRVPAEWMLVFKSILTMEGMGRSLDPDFDLLELGHELIKDLVKDQYSINKLTRDLLWIGKDVAQLMQVLPRQIRWMFRKFNSNDFALEIKSDQLDSLTKQMASNSKRTSLAIVSAGLLIASTISLQFRSENLIGEFPIVSVVLFALGAVTLLKILMSKK